MQSITDRITRTCLIKYYFAFPVAWFFTDHIFLTYVFHTCISSGRTTAAHQLLHLALEPTKLIMKRSSLSLTQMETTRTLLFSTSKTKLSADAKCSALLTSKCRFYYMFPSYSFFDILTS